MIEQYLFKIEPAYYGTANGNSKVLTVTIQFNGEEHHIQRILPEQRPFENEIEYYSRMATETLKEKLKELEDEV